MSLWQRQTATHSTAALGSASVLGSLNQSQRIPAKQIYSLNFDKSPTPSNQTSEIGQLQVELGQTTMDASGFAIAAEGRDTLYISVASTSGVSSQSKKASSVLLYVGNRRAR